MYQKTYLKTVLTVKVSKRSKNVPKSAEMLKCIQIVPIEFVQKYSKIRLFRDKALALPKITIQDITS